MTMAKMKINKTQVQPEIKGTGVVSVVWIYSVAIEKQQYIPADKQTDRCEFLLMEPDEIREGKVN